VVLNESEFVPLSEIEVGRLAAHLT
jgi:hypothetical protein